MRHLSLVSAVYNVAEYLPDFLASLDRQGVAHEDVEVILVDDGSTDRSPEILRAWAASTDYRAKIVTQANAGQGAARNAGLEVASGEWVSFPDPDDIYDDGYLSAIVARLDAHPEVAAAVGHHLDFREATGRITDTHPLRFRFTQREPVSLRRFPRNVVLSVNTTFFPRARLIESGVRFDPRIRPTFEDAHFVSHYFLSCDDPVVSFVGEAHYRYRRRAALTSSLQTSTTDPRRYTDVLRYGAVDLLERAHASGDVPTWLQNTVLYDVIWILRHAESLTPSTGALPREVAEEFFEHMRRIRSMLDDDAIRAFDVVGMSASQREILLHGFTSEPWHWDFVQSSALDSSRRLAQFRYRFTGPMPSEQFFFRGLPAEPMYTKVRAHKVLGIPVLWERSVWISARGTLSVKLDGSAMPIRFEVPRNTLFEVRPSRLEQRWGRKRGGRTAIASKRSPRQPWKERKLERRADSTRATALYGDAWVFMDRLGRAGDNAEHLFRHVRANHPERNAWFVIESSSPDYERLRNEYGERIVAHGSIEWKLLCLNADLLLTSHVDVEAVSPFTLSNGRKPSWDVVFLQHGVTQNDLSGWFNTKRLALLITATEPEYRSIAGNGSAYALGPHETVLTGFPRFDRLAALDEQASAPPHTITVMPTWRKTLQVALSALSDPELRRDEFARSEYVAQWKALLGSPQLKKHARESNLAVRFMPHPEVEPYIDVFEVPDWIEVTRYDEMDIQKVFVETDTLVTDYSSVAFDAAFLGRHIVYFQFDEADLYRGGHIALPGYFSYRDDGFGPVAGTVTGALEAIGEAACQLGGNTELYASRRNHTFTLPMTGNCERVYKEVLRTRRPVSPRSGTTSQPTPEAQPTRYLA